VSDGTVSWRRLRTETAALHGEPHARWLCEEASGAFGDEFDDVLDEPATVRGVARLDSMIARLHEGEPLQYVLGHWSFRRLDLLVDRRVLIPRPETELVAGAAIDIARARHTVRQADGAPVRCVDLGTGSGAIGLSLLAELPRGAAEVWLTDASSDALDVARANAAGLGIAAAGARFAHGSWFEALPTDLRGTIDVVVSNPPYVAAGDPALEASVAEWEPAAALCSGPDGLDDVRAIVAAAPHWLASGGALVLEIGTGQGSAVAALATTAGFVDVQVRADHAGHERIVLATAPRN
jgi:release factor glutamine methyltransferase